MYLVFADKPHENIHYQPEKQGQDYGQGDASYDILKQIIFYKGECDG